MMILKDFFIKTSITIRRRFAKNLNGIDLNMYMETLINEIKDRYLRPKDDEQDYKVCKTNDGFYY